MNKKLLALYGLKYNPFSPELPHEALFVPAPVENFCWRIEHALVREGGFALVSGAPGTGKSVVLRLLAERLSQLREVTVGALSHPSGNLADFYREMGELFGVSLRPHNRWGGFKALRERWLAPKLFTGSLELAPLWSSTIPSSRARPGTTPSRVSGRLASPSRSRAAGSAGVTCRGGFRQSVTMWPAYGGGQMRIQLERAWDLGDQIGGGGFGRVYAAHSEGMPACVAKLVPKQRGAERELLFVDLAGARHVVPIIESGSTETEWVLVMPRAQQSLRDRLDSGAMPADEAVTVMKDVAVALLDLDGQVVHRDLKPENVLWLDGHWCLADFGISRYAEATTAPDTQKYALSPHYAAPERWRLERATGATDVYALGVMAYEMLSGACPFEGAWEELHEAHVRREPQPLTGIAPNLAALVLECLIKAPGARPSPANLLARLESQSAQASPGLARLQAANLAHVTAQSQADRAASAQRVVEGTRAELRKSARQSFDLMSETLLSAISGSAPAARVTRGRGGPSIQLGNSSLKITDMNETHASPWGKWVAPAFDVVAHFFNRSDDSTKA